MNSIRGVALISVLLFMQIWVIISLLALGTTWLTIRSNGSLWHKNQLVLYFNTLLPTLQNKINHETLSCMIPSLPTQELLSKTDNWWHRYACIGKLQSISYYYVVEALGLDPCGYIEMTPHQVFASYFRISVVFPDTARMMLQSTIALPISSIRQNRCEGSLHQVIPGKQMQRLLDRD